MVAFHPIIQNWFDERYGEPTDIQAKSWPKIANKDHLLITAPTGSGKTLTAFLWTLNRFATGELETGKTRVLYISPLKALNNDIQKNLLDPLGELKVQFEAADEAFPAVSVATRSGDTEPGQRRRMLRHPPEILITTPESLNLLLSSKGGQSLLYDIDTLILDEIHGVVDSKRGVYLMSAVERLVGMSGEFQRIALSATVNPLKLVADFVAGYQREGAQYIKRDIEILVSTAKKQYDISIRYPEAVANRGEDEKVWDYLAEDLLPRIHSNQSTLIFVNSRALCEKLTFKINTAAGRFVAYAHHGSLSREIRTEVETRLKEGQLEAIVATSSLEMGIDIGALDEVILVQSPGSIASAIQRIGRAGHQVGVPSRCTIYPTHPTDFLEAAVLAQAVMAKALEPITTVNNPLDVLGQIIISMTGTQAWDLDELHAQLRCATPYQSLTRAEFDLVINMLLGRYADHHIRELKPRVRVDWSNNRIEARKGALLSLYLSGGVIPDRGYFQLRHESDNARIGELDEEFVWEANVGQVFSLGTQTWQVKKITHNDVIVAPAKPSSSAPPFWKAEPINRSFHYSERINNFLEAANDDLDSDKFTNQLINEHYAEPRVANEIVSFLKRQKEHCKTDLPHRHHLIFEHIKSGPGRASGQQLVIHTGWGARVNRPLAMALEAAWMERYDEQPEVFVANESLVLQLPTEMTSAEVLDMVPAESLEKLLRKRLEGSGFFGARFRENAGRSLLLSKGRFNERKPLWMSRLQSQKLMDSVLKYEDFPILLETWRTCFQDEFDIDNLRMMLKEIENREIRITDVQTTTPSPFAQSVAWDQINTYMYMSDTPKSTKTSNLREDLLAEVVFSPGLRPAIATHIIESFVTQRQRLEVGYEPRDQDELIDWLSERSALPFEEWTSLLQRLEFTPDEACYRTINDGHLIVSTNDQERVNKLFRTVDRTADNTDADESLSTFIANWLQYYGPILASNIAQALAITESLVEESLASLTDDGVLIFGRLVADSDAELYCDAQNYEYLLRLTRAGQRPAIVTKPLIGLAPFMYAWQTRFTQKDPLDRLYEVIDQLRGLVLPAPLWESDVLPARLPDYETGHLDLLFQEGELRWLGLGKKRVALCFEEDIPMIANTISAKDTNAENTRSENIGSENIGSENTASENTASEKNDSSQLITDNYARYDFGGLLDKTGLTSHDLVSKLWDEVWHTKISNDTVGALRKGIESNFEPPDNLKPAGQRSRRAAFSRWRGKAPLIGNWYKLPDVTDELDLLEQQELEKERARLLLTRYGIIFRELCLREEQSFKWKALFRALRLMELSGEVVSGHFFENIPGPQYMIPQSLRCFGDNRTNQVFFINATDPISPSGLGLGSHGDHLPRRIASNYLVYHDDQLVMTVGKRGKDLIFLVEPDTAELTRYLAVLTHLSYRSFQPVRQLRIETINGIAATESPYLAAIEDQFNLFKDYKAIVLQREI
jgi:ATP-dependent Lhr-like helicase